MKQGQTLQQLAQTVSTERARVRDYRVRTSALEMDENLHIRTLGDTGLLIKPRELFHQQLAEKTGVPWKYYQRMQSAAPELLRQNANHWLGKGNGERRLLRTLVPGGGAPLDGRAFLSSTYRPLDNFDLMGALVPSLLSSGLEVVSSDLTETKLYLKLTTSRLTAEIKKGDVVQLGLVASNSEVGCGALSIQVLMFRLACLNGAIMSEDLPGFRRVHIGAEFKADDAILTDETRRTRDAAIWLQARDTIAAAVNQTTLDKIVDRMKGIAAIELQDPEKAVELVSKRFDLVEDERNAVMQNLIRGGDVTQWGLLNAVTAIANTHANYDRATEIESLGGKIAALPPSAFGNN